MSANSEQRTPVSVTAARIVEESLNPEPSIRRLTALASADPGFAVRLLAVVNSAAFGLSKRVGSVPTAVHLLGVRRVRNIGLSLALVDMAPDSEAARTLLGNCLRRAEAARRLAERSGAAVPDEAFCAGLFLDVGLLSEARANAERAAEVARQPSACRTAFERGRGLESHAESGARLARAHRLPDELADAILRHHDATAPGLTLPRLMWVTERVAGAFEGGDPWKNHSAALEAMAMLGLGEAASDAVLQSLPADVQRLASELARDVGPQPDLGSLACDAGMRLVELNLQYETVVESLKRLVEEKQAIANQLEEANAQLRSLAGTDPLTGLANRRALDEALVRDLARAARTRSPLSLVILDVDHFKAVNDRYGHHAGDQVLRTLGALILRSVRAGDVAGRFGGEEFLLVLPATPLAGARVVAERLRQSLEQACTPLAQGEIQVTASFGVACSPDGRATVQGLLGAADAALYRAKHAGRNRVFAGEHPALGFDRPTL